MPEEKKKPEEEQTEPETGTQPPTEQAKEQAEETDTQKEKAAEKAADDKQAGENGEGTAEPAEEETTPKETAAELEAAPPELSETDKLKEENFRLKTQLEAVKIGFMPDVIEDAVVLAENIVKREGMDIAKALQAVAKKYPDWKAEGDKNKKSKGGIKVGADSSGQTSSNDERLRQAFGLKKKN